MAILNQKNLLSLTVVTLILSLFPGLMVSGQEREPVGFLYTATNDANSNEVVAYPRFGKGKLSEPIRYNTNGKGTGTGLGNQNGLEIDQANSCLYAINAGSNEITSFSIQPKGLAYADKINSGGLRPISITTNGKYLYVLNAGGRVENSDNISGFTVDRDCRMNPLADSTRPLSQADTNPAQIKFTNDGGLLIVTEKATNKISTYQVDDRGLPSNPKSFDSAGTTPFGFSIAKRNQLYVSEANGGAPGGGSVSSYLIQSNGDIQRIASAIPSNQTATCWLVASNDGRFAYVTNTGDRSISAFSIGFSGTVNLLNPVAAETGTGTAPIDLGLSNNGLNLYALDDEIGSIAAFRVNPILGNLTKIQIVKGLPNGANGIAVR
ncbi:MAG: beta-propeller fold lactonase family protein [Cyanobacteria bacterium J06635_10]